MDDSWSKVLYSKFFSSYGGWVFRGWFNYVGMSWWVVGFIKGDKKEKKYFIGVDEIVDLKNGSSKS